jgi:acyl-coenzyme A thioesterase PaaI-like protein
VRNAFGTLNGGVVAFLAVAAAEQTTGLSATDLTLRYLGQARVGPARAVGSVVRAAPAHAVSDVQVVDAGAGGLTLARATVTAMRR